MSMSEKYTTQLGAGLGMIEETKALLDIWEPGMQPPEILRAALASGRFPNVTARRLRNIVTECFAPRMLIDNAWPAELTSSLLERIPQSAIAQLLFLFTCRANLVLTDFVREFYWTAYAAGQESISNQDARDFVVRANEDGKTVKYWSDEMIERVARYLTRACGDFGLLEAGRKKSRRILPYRIEAETAAVLSYDLHFQGLGDNSVLAHQDWELFGLERADVLAELKSLALRGLMIVQAAGGVTRITWQFKDMGGLANAIAKS